MKYTKSLIIIMIFAVITCISMAGSVSAANTVNNTTVNATNTAVMNTTGQSSYTGPQNNTAKWNKSSLTGGASIVTTSNGTIYVSSGGGLYAISPDGTILWNNPNAGGSTALGNDGNIYVLSEGKLIAVNTNGTIKWTYTTGSSCTYYHTAPVMGSDGVVYFATDTNVYAIDTTLSDVTHEDPKWIFQSGEPIHGGTALSADSKILYFGTYGSHTFYAINVANGSVNWSYPIGTDYYDGGIQATPVVGSDGTIYVPTYTGIYAFRSNGTLKWNYTISNGGTNINSVSISSDGTIYAGIAADATKGSFYAFNPDGTVKWNYSIGKPISCTPVIGADGIIYVGAQNGVFYAFNSNGTVKWNYSIGNTFTNSAIGPNSTLYVGSYSEGLLAFQDVVANFTSSSCSNPLNYTFTDYSSNIPTKWSWDFGDGNTSTEQNPTHTYTAAGKYTVKLTVTTTYGDTNTTTQEITVSKDSTAPIVTTKPSGTYNNPNITLNADDDFDQNPTLHYSIDNGNTWHTIAKSTTLTLADGTYTIQYYAGDASGNKGTTQTATYTIDTKAPPATSNVVSGTYNTNKVVTLTMSENGTIYYTLNGSNPTTASTRYTGPITISSTETLKYIAVDNAGNSSPVYSATYTIDKTAPKISSVYPKNKAKTSRTSTITIKFTENIKNSTNWSKIYVKNLKTGKIIKISKLIKNNTLYLKTSKKSANTTYKIYIPAAALKDTAGNKLAKGYTWTFKTEQK